MSSDTEELHDEFLNVLETGVTQDDRDEAEIPPDEIGAKIDVKLLYESKQSSYCACCKIWDDEPQPDYDGCAAKTLAEKARKRWAILKRQKRHGRGDYQNYSITINSPLLRHRLREIFTDYPDVDPYALELEFQSPYLPFVHRWDAVMKALNEETDETAHAHLKLLVEVLGPETQDAFTKLKNINETGFVAFDDLGLVYISGEKLLHREGDTYAAGILREAQKTEQQGITAFTFVVDVVNNNGTNFGVDTDYWALFAYKGSRPISELTVIPWRSVTEPEGIRAKLIEQGKKFETLFGVHISQYNGTAMVLSGSTDDPYRRLPLPSPVKINERIVVDVETYYSLRQKSPAQLRPLEDLRDRKHADKHRNPSYFIEDILPPVPAVDLGKITNGHGGLSADWDGQINSGDIVHRPKPLTDDELFLTMAWTKGFCLQSKTWAKFHVTRVEEINWNTQALDSLVLGSAEKKLLTAMIASEAVRNMDSFDDFVEGKGKGIIVLLSGPPGVGKTLTAETVAEHLRQPLYRLSAADSGGDVATIELRLSEALVRCAAWNAVLLIDEADVFLETRSTGNLEKNESISTFLKLLGYYAGILILTTNRSSVLDPAFESRIDITLRYQPLSVASRTTILKNFLSRLPANNVDVDEAAIENLMTWPWNGLQIKNAVKTAQILAASEGSKLMASHLEIFFTLRRSILEGPAGTG